jgi:serine/threonine-protein kinase
MTNEGWQRVLEIFGAAVEIEPSEREGFIDRACGGDRELHREIASLLDAYVEDPDFLEVSAASLAGLPSDADDGMIDKHVGVYRIIRRVGSGGMGAVYLAERDDAQFRQRVALKLIKRGMDSEEILRRFRSERQIVASLDHPNIARLLDGGVADDGRLYFVMEYIEAGVPIDRYCDQHSLSIVERLKIFRTVAAAVHYAHQNLVIHRDLKPPNILVSESGLVKLLDFGIAKPLDPERMGVSVAMTRSDLRLLTPEYASPEQIRGDPITTVSDVYALGVLLYELLTGHRPYRLRSRMTSDIERVICEEEPERPSTVVGRVEESFGEDGATVKITPESIAVTRGTRAERLRRELSGDLDNIVLKAMHKDMQRRYSSAEALSDDVRRYLDGEPVVARKDSVGYRAGKFIRRHRIGVAAASAIFTSISGFGVMMAVQSARIARQAREITEQRDKAEQVVTFLKELFQVSDPQISHGEMVTARELLEQGAARITTRLRGQPRLQVELMHVMGEVFINLGLYDQAESLFRESLLVARSAFGDESIEVATSLHGIGMALRWNGKDRESESFGRAALELHRKLVGEEHNITAEMLDNLGVTLRRLGDYKEAEALYRRALAIHQKLPQPDRREMARTMNNLALLLQHNGETEEARRLFGETLEIQHTLLDEDHPELATTMNNLARLLSAIGQYELAEPLDRQALEIRRRVLHDHPSVAQSLNNLGTLHMHRNEPDRAEVYFAEALAMLRGLLDPDHPEILACMHNLARARRVRGAYDDAEALYHEMLALQHQRFGPEHQHIARTLNAMGELMSDTGALERAASYYSDALAMRRKLLGDDHWRTAMTALGYGQLLMKQKRYAESERLLQESHAILEGQAHSSGETAAAALLELYRQWGGSEAPTRDLAAGNGKSKRERGDR